MSASEDVEDGVVCMECHQLLLTEDGEICQSDCPTLCYECWKEAPKAKKKEGLPYFDTETGQLVMHPDA